MVDTLLGGFWAASYVLIIFFSIKYRLEKKIFMPLVSGMLNFSWEIFALRSSGGYWIHVVWLLLDCLILAYNIYVLDNLGKRLTYILLTVACIVSLYFVFQSEAFNGMLISSFVIDVIMAAEYLLMARSLSARGQIAIGLCRLLGDLFAWYGNRQESVFVMIAGVAVLLINIIYIAVCISLRKNQTKKHDKPAGGKKKKCKKKRR